ncbi:unnamed protein product [Rotaria sp. Silwood1]|nr:unnamed protein product [Rotaria sp. Silwood1]
MPLVISAANGSTFLEISKSSFRNISTIIPPKYILEKFDKIVTPFFQKIRSNIHQIRNLSSLRDILLPKLLSDNRLKEAFKGNSKLKVVKDYEEFEKHIDNYFKADYFISRLKEQISDKITKESIVASWLNSYDNWIIKLQFEDTTYYVEVDFFSREIIDFTDQDFSHDIHGLINSPNFSSTHSRIAALENYVKYFSNKEIENILEAADSNSQILAIEEDYDVNDFLTKLRTTSKVE